MDKALLLFRVFFLLLTLPALAQTEAWKSVTIADGLSQGMVYGMAQDKDGFLWIATKDGLNRYDGYNFKVFTHDPYNKYSISGNTCTAILYDSKGRLWIATEKDGLNLFDPKTQHFFHFMIQEKTDRISPSKKGSYRIEQIAEDKSGDILVFTNDPEKIFQVRTEGTARNYPDILPKIELIKSDNAAKQSRIFFREKPSLEIRFLERIVPEELRSMIAKGLIPDKVQYRGLMDSQHRLWILGDNRLLCSMDSLEREIPVPLSSSRSLSQLADGRLAVWNLEYLWLMTPEEFLEQTVLNEKNAYLKLPGASKEVRFIMADNQGTIWAGTKGYGLLKFNPRSKMFHSFLPGRSISNLFQDAQGNIRIRPESFHYRNFLRREGILQEDHLFRSSVNDDFLIQSRDGDYWLISKTNEKKRLLRCRVDGTVLKAYPLPPSADASIFTVRVIEDRHGILWIGLTNGTLIRFDPASGSMEQFSYQYLIPEKIPITETYALFEDHGGTLWIGTQKGLVKAENLRDRPKFTIFQNSNTDRRSLSNDFVSGIVDDPFQPDDLLWVSTKGGGLERLDKRTGIFAHFTQAQGLPNNVVYGVLAGDDKNLWMSTNRGIARLNPRTLIFKNFNKADGLQDDEFNTSSYFKTPGGELMFGGVNGLNIFRPSEIGKSTAKPVIKMIGLKVNNLPVETGGPTAALDSAIEYLPGIDLAYNQNQLSLEFGVMDFSNPANNRYRYQLEGIDEKWVEAGTDRFANFAQLPPGRYTFHVMGSTDGEVWSEPIALAIRIRPPFYQTWWAYLAYLLVVLFTAYRLNRSQINRVRLRQQLLFKDQEAIRLQELDTLKTHFFSNISHEFRTPLTMILGPLEQMAKEYDKDARFPVIQRNARRLLMLINQILDISKLEAGQMKPEMDYVELHKYFSTVTSLFISLAESRGIEFQISQNLTEVWGYLDQDKTEKILTNLLSNAFKFTEPGGRVHVKIRYSDDAKRVEIVISDTGIGIIQEKLAHIFDRFYQVESGQTRGFEGTGIGLALVKELVGVLKGKIGVISQENTGTTFTIVLPLDTKNGPDHRTESTLRTAPTLPEAQSLATDLQPSVLGIESEDGLGMAENQDDLLLIIDDNADIRAYVRSIFATQFRIIEAFDGLDGLQKAVDSIPDLVVCDLMMPRMDGFEFCKQIKSDERTSHIPVVMLTAKANVESRIEGFDMGADEYLTKPFHAEEIKARVRNILRQRERLRHYFEGKSTKMPSIDAGVSARERIFLEKVRQTIEIHLSDNTFGVEELSEASNMSRRQLVRKIKALTGQTAVEHIRTIRLESAAAMLQAGAGNVSEVAYQSGFESLSYFTKVFQEKFGILPSEF